MTCTYCRTELPAGAMFCGECGRTVSPAGAKADAAESSIPAEPVDAPRPGDTAVLDPFPWGLPRSTELRAGLASAPPALDAPPTGSLAAESDIDKRRTVDGSAHGERFVLQFSTGESVSVSGTGLIGRNPTPEPGEYFDSLVTIFDPGKSVSKTHLEFGQDSGTFWISDRFSGNGTVVREPDHEPRRSDPGKRYRVSRGSRVEIGEQFFIVS